jgi:hypothetical protein
VAPPGNQAATEKTNINLYHPENPVYSPKLAQSIKNKDGEMRGWGAREIISLDIAYVLVYVYY